MTYKIITSVLIIVTTLLGCKKQIIEGSNIEQEAATLENMQMLPVSSNEPPVWAMYGRKSLNIRVTGTKRGNSRLSCYVSITRYVGSNNALIASHNNDNITLPHTTVLSVPMTFSGRAKVHVVLTGNNVGYREEFVAIVDL